jgi:hypothetical protein
MMEPLVSTHPARASAVRWLVVVLLGAMAAFLVFQAAATNSSAGGTPTGGAEGRNVFAIAGQVTSDTYGLYLVDPQSGTICLYQFLPDSRRLRLLAARTFIYDRMLDEYNTEPLPREIKTLVERQRRLETTTAPTTRPD